MCVGYTHSGKTTFAKKLVKKHPSTVQIDSDEIAVFLRESYPSVVESLYNKNRPDFSNLKMVFFKEVYRFSLNTGFNIILSNGNIADKFRAFISEEAKKHQYILVTIYFNLSEEIILDRLEGTKKSSNVFIQSKNWIEVFSRQKEYAQLPPSKEDTIYFEIKSDVDQEVVIEEVGKLI